MSSKIRKLNRPFDYESDDFIAAWKEMTDALPRAAAIVAGAFIEDSLRWSIEGRLDPRLPGHDLQQVFETEGAPLHSFHTKIVMAYALGMYGPAAYADLRAIKRIRNAFAHAPRTITFETREIIDECRKLIYLEKAKLVTERKIMPIKNIVEQSPKGLFFSTAKVLYLDLHVIGSEHADKIGFMP